MYLFCFYSTCLLKEDNEEKDNQAASYVPQVQKVTFQRRKGTRVQLEHGFVFCDFQLPHRHDKASIRHILPLQEGVVRCGW